MSPVIAVGPTLSPSSSPTLSLDQDAGEHSPGLYQAALTTTDPLTTCPRAPPPPHPASPGVSLCVERRLARRTPDRQPGLAALLVPDQGSCSHPRCAVPLSPARACRQPPSSGRAGPHLAPPLAWDSHRQTAHTADTTQPDIIDESLALFRPNSLFRNFEIKGPADRVLIYLILFIGDCLGKIAQGASLWLGSPSLGWPREGASLRVLRRLLTPPAHRPTAAARTWTAQDALKHLTTHALAHFALPGEPGFPLNQVFQGPAAGDRVGADALRAYLVHARQETVLRLVEQHVYNKQDESTEGGARPSKWWMAFQVRLVLPLGFLRS